MSKNKMFEIVKNQLQKMLPKKINYQDSVTTKDALSYIYKVFRYSGINMITDNDRSFFICYAIILNLFSTFLLPAAFVASCFVNRTEEFEYVNLLTSIPVLLSIISSTAKVIALIFMVPKLLAAEVLMTELDNRCVEEDELECLHDIRKFCTYIGIAFTVCYLGNSSTAFVCSVLVGHPPYAVYLPFLNWRNSNWELLVSSFLEWLMISGASFQQVANDAYGPIYVNVLRAHMDILCLKIRKLGSNPDKNTDENYQELKMCLKDHKNIIKIYDIISPIIELTVLIQITITALILGITLINILLFANNFSSIISAALYAFTVSMEIFPLCYFCNCLILNNQKLEYEIFHSSWMYQNPSYRKMMIFFLQRAQQPMIMTAGKIYPINLNSFISIAKYSFSLYTFIEKMDIKERFGFEFSLA